MRSIIIAGNWKMNKDAGQTSEYCRQLASFLKEHSHPRVTALLSPVYPFLAQAREILESTPALVAAQDVSAREQGAFTGEVAAFQLASLNIRHCIVGHSERRQYHQESDALIREKLIRLREQGITPILCIGETLAQREAGETEGLIVSQLEGALQGLELDAGEDLVIAYEPVWAIGTGVTATAQQAQEAHALIRAWLSQRFDSATAQRIHLLYGGSVKPGNIAELLSCADIDGGLIGGASLKIEDYQAMYATAAGLAATAR